MSPKFRVPFIGNSWIGKPTNKKLSVIWFVLGFVLMFHFTEKRDH